MKAAATVKMLHGVAETMVVMSEKLTASIVRTTISDVSTHRVVLGDSEMDDFEVARFRDPDDAESLARSLNDVLDPIIEHHATKFLRTLCDHVHEALDALEQG